ncbi:MAG: alkaline phosphatase family protein [Desulfobacterales bacterium]|nr:alkaline phosphatase family protein [Desulfobacterales bacterium]MDX2511836.1 alkaline phosphatase family protein [Desulfobacterales bacterium]
MLNLKRMPPLILILFLIFQTIVRADEIFAAGRDSPKIVIIEFHGLKKNIIQDNLASLPHFRDVIQGTGGEQNCIHLSNVFTTIPAASVPACTSMYTGLHPQNTGVVSTIWFDRRSMKVRSMISYGQQRINHILAKNNVKTLIEHLGIAGKRSLSTMLMIDKGADWSIKTGMFFWGNASAVAILKNRNWFPDPWYMDHKTISGVLTGHLFAYNKSLSGLLNEKGIIPDVTVIQLLGTDIMSHFPDTSLSDQNASIDEIQGRYAQEVLDPQMGRLIHFFKANKIYENMIFFLVSQQGSIKIEKHIQDTVVAECLKPEFKLPGPSNSPHHSEAVVMPGACTKEIYLKNRHTGDWLHPPGLLTDVKPAIDLLMDDDTIQDCVNAMVIRQYPGERNEGVVENDVWWGFDREVYQNGSRSDNSFLRALLPLKAGLHQFELKDYISDGLTRQYTRETAPDIKLINKKGYYFEVDFTKYGHHGSYYPEDTVLSFWIAGPGLKKIIPERHTIASATSTLDLIPMVAHLLGVPQPVGIDGRNPLAGLKPQYISH